MTGALIILLVTIAVGLLLYVYDLRWRAKNGNQGGTSGTSQSASEPDSSEESSSTPSTPDHGEICCGRHLICEKSLVPEPGEEIVYYDDEELDRFADRNPDSYTPQEIDEIRDVLLTLLPSDIPGWARSIQLRRISLPTELRDELFLLLDDCP